jgi:hypothetical protein
MNHKQLKYADEWYDFKNEAVIEEELDESGFDFEENHQEEI